MPAADLMKAAGHFSICWNDGEQRTMKAALKKLLSEAMEAPAGTTSLEGEEGLSATLEESTVGEARMVRISQGFQEIHWFFMLQPGEERPHFFPDDLPFIQVVSCAVTWTEKGGLMAFWNPESSPDTTRLMTEYSSRLEGMEVPSEIEEFLSKAKSAGKETARGFGEMFKDVVPPSFIEKARDAAKGLFGEGLSEDAAGIAETVSTFLVEGAWTGEEEEGKPGHFYSRTFQKGEAERVLRAVSLLGISTVMLTEK
jgi:hypothetical protein